MVKRDFKEERSGREKAKWLSSLFCILFFLLVGRLFDLQFFERDYYKEYAEENQLQRERIVSPRGLIKDRNGEVLVDNVPRFDIELPWADEGVVHETIIRLNRYLPLDSTQVFARFEAWKKTNKRAPFPIIQNADKFEISFVRENFDLFPKLRVESRARRRYRRGEFAAHLLGHVGEVSDQFLVQSPEKGYRSGDYIGKTGVEAVCEEELRGLDGQRVVAVNAVGRVLGELNEHLIPPEPGRNVILTIDARLQQTLEDLIEPLGAGAAVVMNVEDGSILAVVSVPQFDPNKFAVGIGQAEWQQLNEAGDKPLFNRFLQATYPPGSTLKIVSSYTVLTRRVVPPGEALVYCTGAVPFGNRVFRCWKSWGHGYMNLESGFVQSCDSYFYEVAKVTDVDALAQCAREFGLGSRTGIDLPNEIKGLVPDREYYDRRYGKGGWTQGLVLNNIIGQGEYLVSVLQMCRVAAAVANGGYLVQPHVVEEIEGERRGIYPTKKIKNFTPMIGRFIQGAMTRVVQDNEGTGTAARISGMRSAGKTGTAQNPHGADHAWFVGFAPADEPTIALAIIVENAGHGGSIAAPVARQLYLEYFRDDETGPELSHNPLTQPQLPPQPEALEGSSRTSPPESPPENPPVPKTDERVNEEAEGP